jgi:hypothetical protein
MPATTFPLGPVGCLAWSEDRHFTGPVNWYIRGQWLDWLKIPAAPLPPRFYTHRYEATPPDEGPEAMVYSTGIRNRLCREHSHKA